MSLTSPDTRLTLATFVMAIVLATLPGSSSGSDEVGIARPAPSERMDIIEPAQPLFEFCGVDWLVPDADRDGNSDDRVRVLTKSCLDCPAEVVEYRAFDGTTYTMHRWPGRYVALLTPVEWPSPVTLDAEQSRWLLDRVDLAYLAYRDLIGRDPRGSGLLNVAIVESTCGYGCGWIGSKGVEMVSDDWSIQHVIDSWQVDQVPDVLVHELGHNFDLYFDYLAYVQGHYHAWTAFIQTYVVANSRIGLHDVPPDEFLEVSAQDFRNARDQALFDWQDCIRDGNCPTVNDEATWGGLSNYWAQLHDADAVRGMFAFLEDYAANNPPPSGAEARADLHIEAMAAGAGVDLSCAVDAWQWYASPEARTRMAQLYGSGAPLCDDLDGDGFSPAEDDCDDLNPGAHPGAAELANGIDDDCNALIDDQSLIEPPGGDFPTPAMVTLPARIEGTVTLDSDVTDTIAFSAAEPGNYYLRICSTGGFEGWLALENPDETWYSAQHAGRSGCNGRIQYLDEARTWRMEVFASESGTYVVQAEPYGPWPAPPWSGLLDPVLSNGSYTLSASGTALDGAPPTHTRFWVSGVGLVGETAWSDPSSVVWTPDPGIDEGLYAFRAQPTTWNEPLADMTPWRTFTIGGAPGADEPVHLRVTNLGAWQHLKLGYWPGNPWSPKLDPTGGAATHVRITVKDFLGAAPWDKISLASPADSGHRVAIGDFLSADALQWTTVEIPLAAFPAGAFSNVSYLLLPSSSTDQTFQIGIARVEFVGGPTPFVWFGAPDKTDNSLAPSSDALVVELLEGDEVPAYHPAEITDPAPGTMLPGQVVTFRWTDVGADSYRLRTGRRSFSGRWTDATTTDTEFTATTLPTDGTTIYVTLSTTFPDGVELHRVSTYVTAGGPVAAEVVAPTPGSTLPGAEATFSWSQGNGALRYHLSVLDAAESQVFWQGTFPFGTTDATATGLPVDGQALVLLIVTDFTDGTDGEHRYTYTAFSAVQNVAAEVVEPTPGSTLPGAQANFTWTPGAGVADYHLSVLDAAESAVFWEGTFPTGTTSATADGLPVDGQALVLLLESEFTDGTSAERRASYTAFTSQQEVAAEIITPTPNSVLPGRRVTFSWTHPPGATSYMFILKDAAGRALFNNGLYHEYTSLTFENLPTDGQTLELELQTFSEGDLASRRYTFTAATEGPGGDFEFFRISNPGGYRHFKLGYGTEHVWAPAISPAGDHTRLEITMRLDPHPDSQPFNLNQLWLLPDSDPSRGVRIGAWFDGEMSGWQTFWIGLSAFPGDWDNVTHFSIYSENLPPFEIDLARVEFTGGSEPPFVWFGSPEKIDNAFLADGSGGQLSAELLSEGAPDPVAVELLSPPQYTSLQDAYQEFRWTVPIGALVFFDVGSSPGADDIWTWLYGSGDWKGTASNLPTDGRRIYLRLTTVIDDQTAWNDYVFTAVGPDGPMVGELVSPSPGSTLAGTDTTLEWTPYGVAVEVSIGSSQGGADVLAPTRVAAPEYGLPVSGLPTDGRELWVWLSTRINASEWIDRDFRLTAAGGGYPAPEMIWPEPGSVLPGAAVTFNWTDTAPRYSVEIGSTPGGSEYGTSFRDTPNVHVTGLPLDGSTVYLRVGAGEGDDLSTYAFASFTFTAWSDGGEIPVLGQFFRIRVEGGWGHFKLGHNPASLWYPAIDPTAGGMDRIELTVRDVYGNADWDRLVLAPGGDASADVRLGDHVSGQPTEWTTVGIPLNEFPAGAWRDITNLSIFSAGAAGGELVLARVAFRGPAGSSFVWFGDPEVVGNVFEDSAALRVTREDGDQSPLAARSTIVTPPPGTRLASTTATFVWSHTGAAAYRLRVGPAPDDWSIFDQDQGSALETTVGGLPGDGGDIWVAVEARYGSLITRSLQRYLAAAP